jgi:hypothetical protein
MNDATKYARLKGLVADLDRAQRKSIKAMEARMQLEPGVSRARSTTANARWSSAGERRDSCLDLVEREIAELGIVRDPAIIVMELAAIRDELAAMAQGGVTPAARHYADRITRVLTRIGGDV